MEVEAVAEEMEEEMAAVPELGEVATADSVATQEVGLRIRKCIPVPTFRTPRSVQWS